MRESLPHPNSKVVKNEATEEVSKSRVGKILFVATAAGAAITAGFMSSEAADCNPDLGDVCVPGVTVPPDVDPVPGNPQPGETIPVSPTMPPKGEETTTTSTVPETTTSTVPETTVPETTVPETTVPETTVVVTTVPPTMPPITVTVPTVPQHTN